MLRKTLLAVIFFCLVAFCLATAIIGIPPFANAESTHNASTIQTAPQTVRVACYQGGDYMHRTETGTFEGFNIDYLDKIASYTNWTLEYIAYDGRTEALAALSAGEVDLFPSVFQTKEQALFSNSPVGETYTTVYVRSDDTKCAYDDFEAFQGMKVGVIEGSKDTAAFKQYCADNMVQAELITFEHTDDLTEALEKGATDAIATSHLGRNAPYKAVARFLPEPLYIALAEGHEELAAELDKAMDSLILRYPSYFTDLNEKYFGVNTSQDPVFTREEYHYMKEAPKLTVAYASFRAPLAYTNASTGEFDGIAASLFNDITKTTGLQFEFIPKDSHQETIDVVSSGEVDLVYAADSQLDETQGLSLTSSYLDDPMAIIAGTRPDGKRLALPQGFSLSEAIAQDRPDYEISYYPTPKLCLDAIIEGKADIAYADIHVANYLLAESQYTSLYMLALTNDMNSMSIGISTQNDPRLAAILDRCVQFISPSTTTQWVTENSITAHPTSLFDFLRQYPIQVIAGIIVLALLVIGIMLLIFQNKARTARRIFQLVNHDPLTGGWSFSRFQSEAASAIEQGRDHEHALAYIDINRFKSFNATFGFAEGDQLLIGLNNLLGDFVQEGEYYARISADQFVVLVHWTGMDHFNERLDNLDKSLNDLALLKKHQCTILLLTGVSVVPAGTLETENPLDCARYARESIGIVVRSTSALYTKDMKEHDIAERVLQAEAITALERGEFIAHYQPKVEIRTGKINGFEALARWKSPTKGLRAPVEFIPLFEKTGFITELDLHMFHLACQRIRAHIDSGYNPLPLIACNFSRLHLLNDRLPETLQAIVDIYKVPTDRLELELTENIVMEDFERAQAVCHRLKSLGFSISIDDFGKGYSSLGTLQDLPIDVLKIDQSFLMNSENESRSKIILEGIISIAEKLDVKIIVEGVETKKQADMLVAINPRIIAQGYLYSRPLPLKDSDQQFDEGFIQPSN